MKVRFKLTVCVDGLAVGREFDSEDEAIDAIAEANWQKLQKPDAVVTLLVSEPAADDRPIEVVGYDSQEAFDADLAAWEARQPK